LHKGELIVKRHWQTGSILVLATAVLTVLPFLPAPAADADLGADPKDVKSALDKAVAFLKKRQGDDGSFSSQRAGPGVSAVVAAGLLRNGYSPDDPFVARTLGFLEKSVKKDGGIYDKGLANYTTSVSLMAFKEANTKGQYDTLIKNATRFLKRLQEGDSKADEKDVRYGGVGYDGASRPDLSNTQMFLDALQAAGVSKDDPAVQRALKFVSRCQNLPGETNDQAFARKTTADDKGGLTYTPLDPDDSKHKTPDGGLRSLGAMSYAGLKSFLYAGVSKDDPRVKAAIGWIRAHYTLDENPGMGQAGLYYYYHTFAKALTAWGEDRFETADGKKHDWRRELYEALKKRQRDDGSWVNEGDKTFGEADPNLATAFAMLALSYCQPPKK
jgi:squalene-hopene/tetraprenyl-beta-curcumene cyclase